MIDKFRVPSDEIDRRITQIRQEMQHNGIGGLFIAQRVDLFYFSGTAQTGFLYIPAEGQPVLFIKRYYPRAREESCIKNIVEIKSIKEIPGLIVDFCSNLPKTLGFEFDVLPVRDFNFYKKLFDVEKSVDGSPFIHKCRMIKSAWEIKQIERTAELAKQTFEHIKSAIRPGQTKMELSGMAETFARKHGHGARLRVRDHQAAEYSQQIFSGNEIFAAFPSDGENKLLVPDEPIMINFKSVFNGYHMDETRLFAIKSMPQPAMDGCRTAIELQHAVSEIVKPGKNLDEFFPRSVETANSLGYTESCPDPSAHQTSFTGHGIGLELIEPPLITSEAVLEPGMTLAMETKMVLKDKLSSGIKSVFILTETGARLISKVPLEIFIC
ncbi:MAG: Xaa-Pro peptidase family protein [Thermodesulfobacteriota bacterium]|nr:Xaa-Pro peptidase family protein [Thermodesulfobacteriota bacterium]